MLGKEAGQGRSRAGEQRMEGKDFAHGRVGEGRAGSWTQQTSLVLEQGRLQCAPPLQWAQTTVCSFFLKKGGHGHAHIHVPRLPRALLLAFSPVVPIYLSSLLSTIRLQFFHDDSACFPLYFLHEKWRRKWQPTSVFLPGKTHGQRSLVGYS